MAATASAKELDAADVKVAADGKVAAHAPRTKVATLDVELEVQRQSAIGWTIFEYVLGTLLLLKLGTVGHWAGVALLVHAAYKTLRLVQTFIHPPGSFRIMDGEVTLPRGLSMGKPHQVPPSSVTAVYFLRRSVPWNKSSPVLVVELGDQAIAYPRDWFASEADQRTIVGALIDAKQSA